MESSQITQLLSYLGNQNPKVKNEALQIILQLTGTKGNREMLKKSELTKQLLRFVPEQVKPVVISFITFQGIQSKRISNFNQFLSRQHFCS